MFLFTCRINVVTVVVTLTVAFCSVAHVICSVLVFAALVTCKVAIANDLF